MKKIKIEELEYLLQEIKGTQNAYPGADVYYDCENGEIRIVPQKRGLPENYKSKEFSEKYPGVKY